MNSLTFGANTLGLSAVATAAGETYLTITAVTDAVVTYTERYENGSTETFTNEPLNAGQTIYGTFTIISESSGHAKVTR